MAPGKFFLLIVCMLLLLAPFASAQGPEPKTVAIDKEDDGKQIAVSEDAVFEVRLEQPIWMGYLWQIVELDKKHLKVLESPQIPLKQGWIVGGPLLKTWKIKAVKAGKTDLKILLFRPWEGTEKAVGSFHVKIQIR